VNRLWRCIWRVQSVVLGQLPEQCAAALGQAITGWEAVDAPGIVACGTTMVLRWLAVLWRKSSVGSNSEAGSSFIERLLTTGASCRQQGWPMLAFLMAAGEPAIGLGSKVCW
jgi:hypothetical protein